MSTSSPTSKEALLKLAAPYMPAPATASPVYWTQVGNAKKEVIARLAFHIGDPRPFLIHYPQTKSYYILTPLFVPDLYSYRDKDNKEQVLLIDTVNHYCSAII